MKPAIRVQNLSKMYRIGQQQQGYHTLRESIMSAVAAPYRLLQKTLHPEPLPSGEQRTQGDAFWALKDVEFEIKPGEVVGIIGRNGAGKSTLLKVLSNITEPTSGRIEIRGRIGSLLEVGTGFHHELTGRENIYMNGSILGMSKREITRKFDEIVAFAEIDEFLDTPVKRYSSGMYVRLAFAVAAHLEPDILIVDEVLAVGDQLFQRRCLDRIRILSNSGRTVLVVSHNLSTIADLCTSGILLHDGRVLFQGNAADVVAEYGNHARARNDQRSRVEGGNSQSNPRMIQDAFFVSAENESSHLLNLGDTLRGTVIIAPNAPLETAKVGIGIDSLGGQRMLTLLSPTVNLAADPATGFCTVTFEIPNSPLAPGDYSVKISLQNNGHEVEARDPAVSFTIADLSTAVKTSRYTRGLCYASANWDFTST